MLYGNFGFIHGWYSYVFPMVVLSRLITNIIVHEEDPMFRFCWKRINATRSRNETNRVNEASVYSSLIFLWGADTPPPP